MYAHVSSDVMAKFKQLIRKYSHAFHLPNSPLTAIKAFITTSILVMRLLFTNCLIGKALQSYVPLRRSYNACYG